MLYYIVKVEEKTEINNCFIFNMEKKTGLLIVNMEQNAVTKAFGHLAHSRYTESPTKTPCSLLRLWQ